MLQPAFDIPVAIFFWVEFRRIAWKIFSMNVWMLLQVGRYDFRSMNWRSVPNQDHRFGDVPSEMFQTANQLLRIDRVIKMTFVNLARNRQANHRRGFPAKFGNPFQLGRLAFRRPGETNRFCIGESKLIFKHDLCVEPPRFFLCGANPASTRLGSVLRPVRWLWGQVFGHSNPGHSASG